MYVVRSATLMAPRASSRLKVWEHFRQQSYVGSTSPLSAIRTPSASYMSKILRSISTLASSKL